MGKIKSNFLYNSIFQIVNIIVPLITTPYLSRILGAEGLGQYAYAYSIAYYFSLFITLGLNSYGNRTIAMTKGLGKSIDRVFWNIYAMQIIAGIIVSSVYFFLLLCWKESNINNAILFGVVVAGGFDITWFFYGNEEFKSTALRDIFIKIITLLCIFCLVKTANDVWKYSLIRAVGFVACQICLWPLLIKKISFVKPTLSVVISHVKPNLVLFIPNIAVSIYKTMDKVMLGAMAGEIEVGYYESSERVILVPMALITALGTVMMPHMSKLYASSNNNDKAIEIIRKSEHLMIIIASVVSFGIITVAKEFVPLFYGDGYDKCVYLFYWLLPSCIFLAFANVIRTQYLMPNKMDKEFIISLFFGAIVNLIFNIVAIPRLQSIGAAVGTLVAETTVCLIQVYYVKNRMPIIKIIGECRCYLFIAFCMIGVGGICDLFIAVNNKFGMMIIKIGVCGIFWFICMGSYMVIVKKNQKRDTPCKR